MNDILLELRESHLYLLDFVIGRKLPKQEISSDWVVCDDAAKLLIEGTCDFDLSLCWVLPHGDNIDFELLLILDLEYYSPKFIRTGCVIWMVHFGIEQRKIEHGF